MKLFNNKILCMLFMLLAMVGCRPRDVLSNREMRDVLYDLHRVEGALQAAGYTYGHDQEISAYYKSVLDKHGITQAQFDSSLVWFTDNPQIFNKIYPKVIARLQVDVDRESALRDERMEAKRVKNSKKTQPSDEQDIKTTKPQIPWEEIRKVYMFGMENPWKEWKNTEFIEKDVIIFGQLEKK